MRRLSVLMFVGLALVAGRAFAQEGTAPPPDPAAETKAPAAKNPAEAKSAAEMMAVVLATDETAKTITIKKETDPLRPDAAVEKTLLVEEKALTSLKSVRPGQSVKLQLKKDATGKEIVAGIENKTVTSPPQKQ